LAEDYDYKLFLYNNPVGKLYNPIDKISSEAENSQKNKKETVLIWPSQKNHTICY
jgi:hypothetical protein